MIQENHEDPDAVIDKDEPGGICLTRGCIPVQDHAPIQRELVRTMEKAGELGIELKIHGREL